MGAVHNMRALGARWRWSLGLVRARAANRVWDVVGYAAGFCMETTWQQDRATYKPGLKSWRCWVLRKAHAGPHRTGTFRWATGGEPIYDPLAVNLLRSGPEPGRAPRWLAGRHRDVGTRRRDRLALRVAFERIRAAGADRRARVWQTVPTLGELGVLPFTGGLTDAERGDLGERHDWHVHGPRRGQDPEHWDSNGKLRENEA